MFFFQSIFYLIIWFFPYINYQLINSNNFTWNQLISGFNIKNSEFDINSCKCVRMNFTRTIENIFKKYLPSPFTIAILLTFLTILLALFFTKPIQVSTIDYGLQILSFWEKGIWSTALLEFSYQMMLILVLGHVLVLSKPISNSILKVTKFCKNTAISATIVASLTMLVAFFNWGLGLIFGALLARKVGEHAQKNQIKINGVPKFTNICPHAGCPLRYNSDKKKFICPCHNSQFNLEGNCIKGPACPQNIRL